MKKIAVITGGSSGLGKEIAKQLLADYEVIIVSNDVQELNECVKALGCTGFVCDVSSFDQIIKTVEQIVKKFTRIDVLVNSAGIGIYGRLEDSDPERIAKVIEVNTEGTILFTKSIISLMKKQESGKIVNIVSMAGLVSRPEKSVYNASKWALTGFTDSIRQELSPFNISVMGFFPSTLNTKFFERAGVANKDLTYAIDPEEAAKVVRFMLSFDKITFTQVAIRHVLEP